ncbi:MAG TPA: pseudouridine synthase [Candidatus Saccharimonadales bacterium]|nr:pseudouridine synthase [Candidatus Saccharimonadales bacterium]
MRLNQFLARATGMSRRGADQALASGRISVNGQVATLGQQIDPAKDLVESDNKTLELAPAITIILNKPVGLVTSRRGQGSGTIYDLLPKDLQNLKPAGRLDKGSSGLLVLTNDGALAQSLIHPSRAKTKCYQVRLDRALEPADRMSLETGVQLREGLSVIKVTRQQHNRIEVELQTGWNRQIRRTFEALGYQVLSLHRTSIGPLQLGQLKPGQWRDLSEQEQSWLD